MSLTFDEASKQANEILNLALHVGAQMLITHDKSPEEILSQAQKIYDTFTETVKKITGRNIQAAMNEGGNSAEALRVTVREICNDYNTNKIRAKVKYVGKLLTVSGKIFDIRYQSSYGSGEELHVTFEPLNSYNRDTVFVNCTFSLEHENAVAELEKGQTTTITGMCYEIRSTIYNSARFNLKDCKITS